MKKKNIFKLFLFVFILFIGLNFVRAHEYTCRYTGERLDPKGFGDIEADTDSYIELQIDPDNNTFDIETNLKSTESPNFLSLYSLFFRLYKWLVNQKLELFDEILIEEKNIKANYVQKMSGYCPSNINLVIVRHAINNRIDEEWSLFVLLNDDLLYSSPFIQSGYEIMENEHIDYTDYAYCLTENGEYFCFDDTFVATWVLDDKNSDKRSKNLGFYCTKYNKNYGNYEKKNGEFNDSNLNKKIKEIKGISNSDFEKKIKDYDLSVLNEYYKKNCSKNKSDFKCIKTMSEFNTKKNTLTQFCKQVVKYRDSGSTCMEECLHLNESLAELTNDKNNRECFMSDEIIAFVYNILKWVKYIAPALVIILGILDFVKALASQEDDAMKKAQKKFITRLIAAVLLFLLPLIIDYVLNVFNLVNDNCDITKLF